jgi:hypothetical protein
LVSSSGAPITIASPLTATLDPNASSSPVFAALMNACCDHVTPLRTKTYAAPELSPRSFGAALTPVESLSSLGAPTTMVSPLIATDDPNSSSPPGFDAFR